MEQRQKDGKNRLLNFGNSNINIFTSSRISKHFYKPHRTFIEFYSYRKTGFLFQEKRLPKNLTAMQNIAIFMDKPDEGEIIALAAKVGLTAGDLNKYPTELSGGMAKRVAFLRLQLCGCDLALLDEPFVGLDRDLRDILVAMLVEKIERQGMACMLVTHDRFEAARLSHEIMLLSTKGMNVQNVITLPTPLSERDSAFEEAVVAREFQGIHYYE